MKRTVRPYQQLPKPLLLGFLVVFAIQVLTHQLGKEQAIVEYTPLGHPLSAPIYEGLSFGSVQLMSYLLAIRLQLHDNQAGRHILYKDLNYNRLVRWLEEIYRLNLRSEYPMLLASRVYSSTRDKQGLRIILEYIDRTFDYDPQLHWRRLAEATVIAKHQLGDLELALRMAEKLASQPKSIKMPRWARDKYFLVLADMNEYEAAIAIVLGLLQSDAVNDPDEARFLKEKLLSFQQKLSEFQQKDQ